MSRRTLCSLAAACTAIGLSNCAGLPLPSPLHAAAVSNVAMQSPRRSDHSERVYVGNYYDNDVDVFTNAGKQIGTLKAMCKPEGLASDAQGDVYEADQCAHEIRVFASDTPKAKMTIGDHGFAPLGIAIDRRGDVAVANVCATVRQFCQFDQLDQGNVTVFLAPDYKQTRVYANGCFYCFFVAFDAAGNLWADGNTSAYPPGTIGYWPAGSQTYVPVNIAFNFPGGLLFDANGNLVLDDQDGSPNGGSEVFVYAPGSTKPFRSIAVQPDGSHVVQIALGAAGERLYAPDDDDNAIRLFNYRNGQLQKTITPAQSGGFIGVTTTY